MLVFLLASFPVFARAQLPESLLMERVKECDLIGVDWHSSNVCYMKIAVERNDPKLCDNINWSSQRVACKRKIIYNKSWSPRSVFPQIPFAIFVLSFLSYLLLKPPRSAYLKGAVIGALLAEVGIYISSVQEGFLLSVQPYVHFLKIPVTGIMTYAPFSFTGLSSDVQFISASVIFYGLVLGILISGERKCRFHAFAFILLALLFTFWMHPQLDALRHTLSNSYEAVTL